MVLNLTYNGKKTLIKKNIIKKEEYEMLMNSETNWARFLIVDSANEDLPLQKLSPFAIQKGFQAIAGTLKNIKRLRDGSFLVECGKMAQAQNLLQTNRFNNRPVKVSIHKTLNSSRGVIRCRDLADMSEVEIRDELRDQGVVGVKKEGEVIPTNTLFMTFGFHRTSRKRLQSAI